jgi:hypothetical protein
MEPVEQWLRFDPAHLRLGDEPDLRHCPWKLGLGRVAADEGERGRRAIGTANVSTTRWAQYPFTVYATAGPKELRVTFDNDARVGTEDRNLYLDKLVIDCPVS